VFNEKGLETTSCCSGHVGNDFVSTSISFIAYKDDESVKKLQKLVKSNKLYLNWSFSVDYYGRHFDLYLRDGLYGTQKLKSTPKIMKLVYSDLNKIQNNIKK